MNPPESRLDGSGIRRAELIGALSLALDLATGEPIERSLRTCILGQHFGRAIGMSPDELSDVYYVSLLRWLGCTADSHTASRILGDEIAIATWFHHVVGDGPLAVTKSLVANHGSGKPIPERVKHVVKALAGMRRVMSGIQAHCEVAQQLADRMGFNERVQQDLGQVYEIWNGTGVPRHLKGEQISRVVRVALFAEDMQMFHGLGGPNLAVSVALRRSDKAYDPALVDSFCQEAEHLLECLDEGASWTAVLEIEPAPRQVLSAEELDQCLHAIANFCDLKSTYLMSHSTGVAQLAEAAAEICGLPQSDVTLIRRAGLVHEIGIVGISNSIVEKAGPLTESEAERLRLHSYYTERVLARPDQLARIGAVACMHHERLDGSGYHKGVGAVAQSELARILAAACAFQTDVSGSPQRPPMKPEEAAASLQREAADGKLDPAAVNAILAAAGHHSRPARRVFPNGLSEREVEVLRLMARGLARRQIAESLTIADKTVAHHIEHVYNKLGVSTRAAAALFAMEHGLL